jgi:hypothetical protein
VVAVLEVLEALDLEDLASAGLAGPQMPADQMLQQQTPEVAVAVREDRPAGL